MVTTSRLSSEKFRNVNTTLEVVQIMKNIIVRATVVALVLTGAAASTQVSAATTSKATFARNSVVPTPMCAPDDPNACGMR